MVAGNFFCVLVMFSQAGEFGGYKKRRGRLQNDFRRRIRRLPAFTGLCLQANPKAAWIDRFSLFANFFSRVLEQVQ